MPVYSLKTIYDKSFNEYSIFERCTLVHCTFNHICYFERCNIIACNNLINCRCFFCSVATSEDGLKFDSTNQSIILEASELPN